MAPLIAKATAAKDTPDILWHYTSGHSLIQIVQSGELWSTQISCLNDHREFRHASTLFLQALEEYADTNTLDDDDRFLFEEARKALLADSAPKNWWFVACFSDSKDDLSQWRAYSGGEGGYAIAFHAKAIALVGAADQSYLAPVQYDENIQRDIAREVAAGTFKFFREGLKTRGAEPREEWLRSFFAAWSDAITYLAPIVKHKAFAGEREWRFVRKLRDTDFPRMRYVQRQMMMSRHLPLTLSTATSSSGKKLLPIAEVMVGPSRHKQVSQISVGDLLRTVGYPDAERNVTVSDAPFQTL
ncbi:MAG TPA: DUF2971 domain-containing protein [Alphaproteobacteria bacterium]|nr:DUF2971 domain-containing protein [Alphaproteobacteria bacterium]